MLMLVLAKEMYTSAVCVRMYFLYQNRYAVTLWRCMVLRLSRENSILKIYAPSHTFFIMIWFDFDLLISQGRLILRGTSC